MELFILQIEHLISACILTACREQKVAATAYEISKACQDVTAASVCKHAKKIAAALGIGSQEASPREFVERYVGIAVPEKTRQPAVLRYSNLLIEFFAQGIFRGKQPTLVKEYTNTHKTQGMVQRVFPLFLSFSLVLPRSPLLVYILEPG